MDSEHRHELEENALAGWLAERIERVKPHLPAIGLGLLAAVAAVAGWNGYRAAQQSAREARWQDFSVAVEGDRPKLDLLEAAYKANPGTSVEEWSEVTWADGKLWEAARQSLRDRAAADEALGEAIAVYERRLASRDRLIAERASYQLARAYELRGDVEAAREQYGRVTGAFAELASERAEALEAPLAAEDAAWLAGVETASATSTVDPSLDPLAGADLTPDDIAIPDDESADLDADAALEELLGSTAAEDEASAGDEAEDEAEPSLEDLQRQVDAEAAEDGQDAADTE